MLSMTSRWKKKLNLEQLARAVLPAPTSGRFFSASERRTFVALAEVLLEGSSVKLAPETVADNVDGLLLRGGSRRAWRVRVLYALVELMPLVVLKKRFSRLDIAARRALVQERFMHGRYLWAICAKSRHLINLGCYGDAQTNPAVGFVPVPTRERYVRRRTAN